MCHDRANDWATCMDTATELPARENSTPNLTLGGSPCNRIGRTETLLRPRSRLTNVRLQKFSARNSFPHAHTVSLDRNVVAVGRELMHLVHSLRIDSKKAFNPCYGSMSANGHRARPLVLFAVESSIHVGAWSLAFGRSLTQASTPAARRRGSTALLNSRWSMRKPKPFPRRRLR
jgi:hypothetical protein